MRSKAANWMRRFDGAGRRGKRQQSEQEERGPEHRVQALTPGSSFNGVVAFDGPQFVSRKMLRL